MSADLVALDYETTGLNYYEKDFRVISAAFSWRGKDGEIKSLYLVGEPAIRSALLKLSNKRILTHNLQFEYGVTKYRFPDINLNWYADTMRLTQVWDNGGKKAQRSQHERTLDDIVGGIDEEDEKKVLTGLSLQASASRVLPSEYHNHKAPYYEWLRWTGVKKGTEGANLTLLPPEMLEAYNVADTEITLRLYETITEYFTKIQYDWTKDHFLYMFGARLIAESKGRGIRVDRKALESNITLAEAEMAEILAKFRDRFEGHIDALEQQYLERIVSGRSTEKGQMSAWETAVNTDSYKFNLNSTKQKADLFLGRLEMKAEFLTKTGKPAFGKAFLKSYGEGGVMLEKRGTLMIGLKQMKSLLAMSEYDGRYHVDLKAASTATGRYSGGTST